ncbi:MAG: 4Fe-4S dicluster domain-containing protein [Pseudomonadota bacterium]
MSLDRRQFLKIAGISAMVGVGGLSGFNLLSRSWLEASEDTPNPNALTAKRWGMAVDMAKFTCEDDYKRVMDACRHAHNIPIIDTDQEVKWIWEEKFANTFPDMEQQYAQERIEQMSFPVFCNHCDNPPCVRVCPTKATYKRPDGIVAMDYHRCIGCRFCMAACPYGSRSFNFRDPRPYIALTNKEFPTRMKGVVEKCNFCVERLAKGLQPACVEASNGAMVFGDLADPSSEIRGLLRTRYSIQRKPNLGTHPSVYYLI